MSKFKFSQRSIANMSGIDEKLRKIAERAIELSYIDFGIPSNGGMRSADVQHELFKQGKSKCDGYTKLSNHQTGKALDFYAVVDGKASWDLQALTMVAAAMFAAATELGYTIEWGGHWKMLRDYPHIELA